LTRVANSHL